MKITIPEGTSLTIHNEGGTTHEVDFGRRTRRGPMTEERWNTIQALLVEGLGDDEAEQAIAQLRSAVVVADAVSTSGTVDDQAARLELQDIARGPCHCSGWRCSKHLAVDEIARKRPRVVAISFNEPTSGADQVSALADEESAGRIAIACQRIASEPRPAYLADLDAQADLLREQYIDLADELFVYNLDGTVSKHMERDIEYAELSGKPIRWLEPPAEMCRWCERPIRLKDGQTLESLAYRSESASGYVHKTCMNPHSGGVQ